MTRVEQLAESVYAVLPAQFGSSNAGFVVGSQDTLVIDTRMAPLLAAEMRIAIESVTANPVTRVVNTHFHGDHLYGNQVFAPPAEIISHRLARDELVERGRAGIDEFMEHYNIAARYPSDVVEDIRNVRILPADTVFDSSLTLEVGDIPVRLEFVGPAHTRGDIVVYLPEQRVLFAGDLVFNEIHPYWLDGYLDGTLAGLRMMGKWDVEVLVPGHGPLTDGSGIRGMLEYFEAVDQVLRETRGAGGTEDDAVRALEQTVGGYGSQPHRLATTVRRFWGQLAADHPGT